MPLYLFCFLLAVRFRFPVFWRNAAEALLLADWYEPWLHVFCWTACGVLAPAKFTGRTGCHKQLDDAHRILPGGQLASLVGFMILDTRVCMLATTTSQDCSGELEVAGAAGARGRNSAAF